MTAADPQTTGHAQPHGDLFKTLDVTPLARYDALAVSTIVKNRKGGINSCGIPFSGDLPPGRDSRYCKKRPETTWFQGAFACTYVAKPAYCVMYSW